MATEEEKVGDGGLREDVSALKQCGLRMARRVARLDKRQDRLETTFQTHAKALDNLASSEERRHNRFDEALANLRSDFGQAVRDIRQDLKGDREVLHGRINKALRTFYALALTAAGFLIVTLITFIIDAARNGWPWDLPTP